MMDRKTQYACLAGGGLLLVYSLTKVVHGQDWTLLVISVLILAFTWSAMAKSRRNKD
jgi:hypothetical protein